MKKENDLIDSLLKEHAKHKGVDEKFLNDLEDRLDLESGTNVIVLNSAIDRSSSANKMGLRLGVGIAACAALYLAGSMLWTKKSSSDTLAVNSEAANEQVESVKVEMKSYKSGRSAPSEIDDAFSEDPILMGEAFDNSLPSTSPEEKKSPESALALEREEGRIGADMSSPGNVDRKSKRTRAKKAEALVGKGAGQGYSSKLDPGRVLAEEIPSKRMKPFGDSRSENYGKLIENKFTAPVDKESKRSTFAIDVDTASYANVRRMIVAGSRVPADSVRIEEMINYFDYQYKKPSQDGKHPFAVYVDASVCPWNEDNKLVRIALQGKEIIRENRPASNVVFLLDVSGSMNRANKLPLLKESLKYLLEEMNEKDKISIVVYAGASGLVLPATMVDDAGRVKIIKSMEKLGAGGSTAGGAGIKLAYKIAQENFIKGGVNRVILATDGDFNVGVTDPEMLKNIVKKEARSGVDISVLGFGAGNLNDSMLELITNNGNGNYSYIDTIKEGRKVLLEDMMGTLLTIAKDVKIQVEFNPARVKEYRLIGYSNRMLPNSAFLDKAADAGEIGAGHQVTAFYEIVPGEAVDKSELDNLRYSKKKKPAIDASIESEHMDELLNVKLAYKLPAQKMNDESTYLSVQLKDEVTPLLKEDKDFSFAASVALFGMILRDSDHLGDGNLALVSTLAEMGKGADGNGHRAEFMNLVKKLKDLENK